MTRLLVLLISILFLAQTTLNSVSYALSTLNNAVIYSNGRYMLTLRYRDYVLTNSYLIVQNGSYRQYVLSYRTVQTLLDHTDSSIYRELLIGSRSDGRLKVEYELSVVTDRDYVKKQVDYFIEHEASTVRVSNLSIVMNTTSLQRVFTLNATVISIYLLLGGFEINVDYVERNKTYWIRIEISNLVLNESLIQDPDLRRLLCIPADLDPRLFIDNRIEHIVVRDWLDNRYFIQDRLFMGVKIAYLLHEREYVLPIKLPGNYSANLVLGYSDVVSLDSIDWTITVRNNTIDVTVVVEGYGYGLENSEKILSCIENIHRLSRIYGCIETKLNEFEVEYRNSKYSSINLCPELDISEIEVTARDLESRGEVFKWSFLIPLALIITLVLLIITLLYVIRRAR